MEEVLKEKENLIKSPKIGDIVEGKIIGRERSALFLDLGIAGTGIIYGKEFQEAKEELKGVKIGDRVFAKIIDLENEEGYVELSVKEAGEILAWETLRQKKESDETLTVKILGANKGGLLAGVLGIPAFIPVSQLSPEHYPRVEGGETTKILGELQKFIGKELEVKVFDFSQKEGKLILSEKAKETEKIKEVLKNYKVGDIVEGEITGLTNFGAFLKFPASAIASAGKGPELEGLIHISELDWKIIEDPSAVVKVGEKVKAKIIDISNDKVSLSLKTLKKDPWQNVEKKYKKGDIVKGKITKFNPFGAFVEISPKIQGLCHISEFGTQKKMQDTLKIGKKYDFQILLIDPKEHRMSLKLVSS
ncbi:MAG: 30S ribosomal protein S1 [Candidatus Nealsonbacteria bacterium CG23_combo_of_CG06-09_8_20_14_all_36_12]|uniref:30S ribosomal protein S1 n=1 Tax=Candidatus Nealsonbacteria bacterium CG23_combo_of_CG06-09_8_20_14_all_36_12 TaxID=1974718 RepID=A0A2G9Z0I6_9BACT|nr:MAG: 30S ribosomal protein S1 [Candidatus Nealsonbacteria bacterium CG23_combo_of_CG06-09_8_20_14_all_36_12]